MGLDDRDYMRERNRRTLDRALRSATDRPFAPPEQKPSLLVMIGCWVSVGFLVFKAYGWIEDRKGHRPPANRIVQQQPAPDEPLATRAQPAMREPLGGTTAMPQRQVTYEPAPLPEQAEPARPRTGGTLYLCRDYGGGTFWASDHCSRHSALIDRMVSVPEGMPFEQQVQLAEQRRRILASPEPMQTAAIAPANPAPINKALCQSLDERVNQLDAMAREPQSGSTQDWIRLERQKTRDEQFRLHC